MLAFACIEIMVPWWTLTDAERHLSSSTAGLLIAGVPIVGVAAARLFGDAEHLGTRRLLGLALGLSGVAVLTVPHLTGGDARSLAEVLLTVIGYATAPVIAARHLKNVPSLHLTAACLTLAALVYAPAAAVTHPSGLPSPADPGRPRRPRRHLHRGRLRGLPGTDQGGGPDAGDGDHVRQPGRRRRRGRPLPRRTPDPRRPRGLRPHPGRLCARHGRTKAHPTPGTMVHTADEPGGRPRGGPCGPSRGTSGLHRARWWLTATRGDPRDSATENRPPWTSVLGKGETVV